jgi:hypothetical protein
VDPSERRWVVIGAVVACIGIVACTLTVVLWRAPKGLLESDPFMASMAVTVVGMALIVAAGARDALLNEGERRVFKLSRVDTVGDALDDGGDGPVDTVMVRTVYLNRPDGDGYRSRYEVALQPHHAVQSLLLEASAPTMLGIRFDEAGIDSQDGGGGAGRAWASVAEPPTVFRLDVVTGGPEVDIQLDGLVR